MIFRGIVWFVIVTAVCRAEGATAGRPGATVPSLFTRSLAGPPVGVPTSGGLSASLPPKAATPTSAPAPAKAGSPTIHPAVVRVVAPGDGTISYGSGTLVDVRGDYGLVITNHHVINEATGNISVVFPDGFYSLATVRKVDQDWDLAALVIKRPNVRPVPLAMVAPRPGEPLTIAGYGSGNYRAIAGRCTQYVAPDRRMPYEMVELAASARKGDSGGPILNGRGELAGVLFGEGGGRTAGSYCGRVKWFLASLTNQPVRPPANPAPREMSTPEDTLVASDDTSEAPLVRLPTRNRDVEPDYVSRPANTFASKPFTPSRKPTIEPAEPQPGFVRSSTAPTLDSAEDRTSLAEIAGATLTEQLKTVLAILGSGTVLMVALRILGGSNSS